MYDPTTLEIKGDGSRIKLHIETKTNKYKLDILRTGGYATEESVAAEADLYGFAVVKDLARHWIPVTFAFDQYVSDFNQAS